MPANFAPLFARTGILFSLARGLPAWRDIRIRRAALRARDFPTLRGLRVGSSGLDRKPFRRVASTAEALPYMRSLNKDNHIRSFNLSAISFIRSALHLVSCLFPSSSHFGPHCFTALYIASARIRETPAVNIASLNILCTSFDL